MGTVLNGIKRNEEADILAKEAALEADPNFGS